MRNFIYILVFFLSCKNDKIKTIRYGNFIAKGEIIIHSNDTIFNGLIKYYDAKTNELIFTEEYLNGNLNGPSIVFNDGLISHINYYENGFLNGWSEVYGENETLTYKQFNYFGLPVGPSIKFNKNEIDFSFYSIEKFKLFNLKYDTLIRNRIEDFEIEFFYFNYRDFSLIENNRNNKMREFFLYLPQPPGFYFNYSIIRLKNDGSESFTELSFDKSIPFTQFEIPLDSLPRAIKLEISTNLRDSSIVYLKRIPVY